MARERQSKRLLVGAVLFLAGALTWALLGSVVSSGAPTLRYADFSAPSFTPIEYSTHNRNGNTVCNNFAQHAGQNLGAENQSDLDAKQGSYMEGVHLPQGVSVRSLTLFVNDFDGDNAYVYLIRKRIANGLDPRFQGYKVMGFTHSTGAVNGVMRKFTDTSIDKPVVDNEHFFYFLELVNCGNIEPFAAQIAY